jgi:hypothetical protein
MSYVLGGLGAAAASSAQQLNAQLKAAQAEQQTLLDQWNDAEFKNPPDTAAQARLDPLIATANKRVNDLRERLRKIVGGDPNKKIETELTIKGETPSILPWVVGGLFVVLAIGAATRQKSTIAPT